MSDTSDLVERLVERAVDRHHDEGTSPGFAYGIVQDGVLVHSGGRGEAGPDGAVPEADTVFRIASMTKSFTAATVLRLRDDGLLRLDDPVADHLPEVAKLNPPTEDAPALTIRHLLTMASGLPTDDPWGDRQQDLPHEDFAELLEGGLTFAWTPGTRFEYSNTSYALLGRLVSAVGGAEYPDLVRERLLTPLAMTSTGFSGEASTSRLAQGHHRYDDDWQAVPPVGYGAFAPMGGLFSTVADLARWVSFLAAGFPPRNGGDTPVGVLSRASRREMQTPHLGQPPVLTWTDLSTPPIATTVAYGFGLRVELGGRHGTVIGHSGGYPGFGSNMRWHPDSGLGVVVLANATYAPATRLAQELLAALLQDRPGAPGRAGAQRRPGSSPTPRDSAMLLAAQTAQDDVTRLLNQWNDAVADRLLAMNVHLDDPLPRRRREIDTLLEHLGPFEPDDAPVESDTPAHRIWWLRGPGGRLRVEIRMTPEAPPRVQTLSLTGAADPSPALARLVDRVVGLLADPAPHWPDDVPLGPGLDPDHLTRQLRVAQAWAGPCTVGPPLSGDGVLETTVRLDGDRLPLRLTLALEGDRLATFTLAPEG